MRPLPQKLMAAKITASTEITISTGPKSSSMAVQCCAYVAPAPQADHGPESSGALPGASGAAPPLVGRDRRRALRRGPDSARLSLATPPTPLWPLAGGFGNLPSP